MSSRSLLRLGGSWGVVAVVLVAAAWVEGRADNPPARPNGDEVQRQDDASPTDPYQSVRNRMVERHLIERGITDERVIATFRAVPRHRFVPDERLWHMAYEDEALPIGEAQTITAPFDVAFMTEVLQPQPTDKVFEVGTGSGYQASILAQLVDEVYSVEIHEPLARQAEKVIKDLGYDNIHVRAGDGYLGWPEAAPFDAIIVTCAPRNVPPPLVEQLKEGGRMVIPLGDRYEQMVYVLRKQDGQLVGKPVRPTLFVPMTGRAQKDAPKAPPAPEPEP